MDTKPTINPKKCSHNKQDISIEVVSLKDSGKNGSSIMIDVIIICDLCKTPFCFLGLPMGINLSGASTSFDGTEGRFALEIFDIEAFKKKIGVSKKGMN